MTRESLVLCGRGTLIGMNANYCTGALDAQQERANNMKRALVCGAGGFIGGHVVKALKKRGYWVRGLDIKQHDFEPTSADEFHLYDLREPHSVDAHFKNIDECYNFAATMGGAGFCFTGEHDAEIMHDNVLINTTVVEACVNNKVGKVFFSSSACVYPFGSCQEENAYPAMPDSDYGFEKLFSERLYQAYARHYGIQVRIARLHNIYGPLGTWRGGREKAPAAICRKVAEAENFVDKVEIWGSGDQTRSFCYIDDCVEGTLRLVDSDVQALPLNIGSAELFTIDQMAHVIMAVAGKQLELEHVEGPVGVHGRNSHNELIKQKLGWAPATPFHVGISHTYRWIAQQVAADRA